MLLNLGYELIGSDHRGYIKIPFIHKDDKYSALEITVLPTFEDTLVIRIFDLGIMRIYNPSIYDIGFLLNFVRDLPCEIIRSSLITVKPTKPNLNLKCEDNKIMGEWKHNQGVFEISYKSDLILDFMLERGLNCPRNEDLVKESFSRLYESRNWVPSARIVNYSRTDKIIL